MDNTPPRRNLRTQNLSSPCPSQRILFLERADSPLQQAGVSQEQDNELGSFHRFSQLPTELQDQIWEATLEISSPTAHYIDVELESDIWRMRVLNIKRECDGCKLRTGRESTEAIYPVRLALMQTCRRSYAFVKGIWERNSPGTPLLDCGESYRDATECNCTVPNSWKATPDRSALHAPYFLLMNGGGSALQAPYIVLMNRGGSPLPWKQPMKRVDTSRDLMIFYYSVPNVFGNDRIPSGFKRGPGTNVKQVAVPYSTNDFWHYLPSLACMFGVLNELRTLYLLMDPSQVRIQPRTFIDGTPGEYPPSTRNPQLREYLHRHRRTPEDTSQKTYHLCDRIYYELPDETVLFMTTPNGITATYEAIEEVARKQRGINGGVPLPPLVIRFMSWKVAPGVRGRFDNTNLELL